VGTVEYLMNNNPPDKCFTFLRNNKALDDCTVEALIVSPKYRGRFKPVYVEAAEWRLKFAN
jgi:hypothetical protein